MDNWVAVGSADLGAEIDPLGAQLSVLRDRAGRNLLWDGDAAVWAGRAPVLFPIVGAVNGGTYRVGAKTYPLPRHGFARGKAFEVVSADTSAATFRLRADPSTLAVYPFRFELDLCFAVAGPTLSITAWVRNVGDEDMPASFGYHPAFRWPLPFEQARAVHFIEFEADETAPVRRIDSAGLMTPVRHPTPVVGRELMLTDAMFQDDVVIFDALRSRSVLYGAAGGPRIQVGFPDAAYLGLWMKPGADFICIEPWRGVTDPQGFKGEFRDKPGVFIVKPGAAVSVQMSVTLSEGAPAGRAREMPRSYETGQN